MAITILEKMLPLWSGTSPTVECPSCSTAINVPAETCPNCGSDVAIECRACGNTIEREMSTCSVCEGAEYEVFLLE
jgi:anaerobic ribonucleoside-triphosphate reductase